MADACTLWLKGISDEMSTMSTPLRISVRKAKERRVRRRRVVHADTDGAKSGYSLSSYLHRWPSFAGFLASVPA
jgi:hypothetical protein